MDNFLYFCTIISQCLPFFRNKSDDVFLKILDMLEKGESQAQQLEEGTKPETTEKKGEWTTQFEFNTIKYHT